MGDLFVAAFLLGHENGNVSIGLRQRIVDLVGEFKDVVLNFTLRRHIHSRKEHLLDDRLEVTEAVLRLGVAGLVCLNH